MPKFTYGTKRLNEAMTKEAAFKKYVKMMAFIRDVSRTMYEDCKDVLRDMRAIRAPAPDTLEELEEQITSMVTEMRSVADDVEGNADRIIGNWA